MGKEWEGNKLINNGMFGGSIVCLGNKFHIIACVLPN